MNRDRAAASILKAAGEFIARESNGSSLITVTRSVYDEDGTHIIIYFSVYPDKDTYAAQDFLTRRTGDFAAFLKTQIEIRAVPRIRFLPEPNHSTPL